MARLILKSPYIKSTGGASGYLRYIATRERVELIPDDRPPTRKQEQLIAKLVKDFPDSKTLYEYEDYLTKPAKVNASAFITLALEANWDAIHESEQYMKYIATRPRAERIGAHGLFSDEETVSLEKAVEELENYTGNVWTHIISLKREDAARLGYDNAAAWRNLIRAHRNDIAAAMKIPPGDFRWYAAFHDEGEHPHIHMMAWSAKPGQAYLSKEGIRQIKSKLTNDIFRNEMLHLYEQKSESRDELVRQARRAMLELVQTMRDSMCDHPDAEQLVLELAAQLGTVKGKKSYGYVTNREKTVERLISGVNCVAQTAQDEFEAVKKQFRKTDGRSYYHIVQAFAPDDPLDFDTAHEIGLKFAEYFKGYQCVVVTHMNTAHIHNHIIMNSVNFETGQKFHQSAREMQQAKEYSNQLCREYGLSFTESKADPFRIPAWKKRLCRTIKEAMENCATREEFIAFMAEYGYKVRWEANQKYITYTTPENVRCRDNKLFDQTLLRSSMEAYFDMGGCEYLESRIDATEYGELLPTVDDAVCGLISILDAMNTGDNDRFHLETLHHSKQEIRRILERGGKIDRTVEYAVDDEDEEYEQYHGFSMRM